MFLNTKFQINKLNICHILSLQCVRGYSSHAPTAILHQIQKKNFCDPSIKSYEKKETKMKGNCKAICVTHKSNKNKLISKSNNICLILLREVGGKKMLPNHFQTNISQLQLFFVLSIYHLGSQLIKKIKFYRTFLRS